MIFWVRLLSKLPFPVLHRISDGLYFLLYRMVGYRKRVVRENLLRAFPEKPLSEILSIEKAFFRNFTDILIETIKGF